MPNTFFQGGPKFFQGGFASTEPLYLRAWTSFCLLYIAFMYCCINVGDKTPILLERHLEM